MKQENLKVMVFSERFESFISCLLLIFSMVVIAYQVLQLIWNTIKTLGQNIATSGLDYVPETGRPVAVLFFNILLMIEIMETVKLFRQSHEVKLRIILIVCLIAVSRKVLELGVHSDPPAEIAIAALVLSFALSFYLVGQRIAGKDVADEKHNEDFTDGHHSG
jgi:uncharacterized membrane protein (DUF373 family)